MFKSFVSYILGFLTGFLFFVFYINGSPYWLLISGGLFATTLGISFWVSHRVHKRMQKKHEDMIRSGSYTRL